MCADEDDEEEDAVYDEENGEEADEDELSEHEGHWYDSLHDRGLIDKSEWKSWDPKPSQSASHSRSLTLETAYRSLSDRHGTIHAQRSLPVDYFTLFLFVVNVIICCLVPFYQGDATCYEGLPWERHVPFIVLYFVVKSWELFLFSFNARAAGTLNVIALPLGALSQSYVVKFGSGTTGFYDAYTDALSATIANVCHSYVLSVWMTVVFFVGVVLFQWIILGYLALKYDKTGKCFYKLFHMDVLAATVWLDPDDETAFKVYKAISWTRLLVEDIPQMVLQIVFICTVEKNITMIVSILISLASSVFSAKNAAQHVVLVLQAEKVRVFWSNHQTTHIVEERQKWLKTMGLDEGALPMIKASMPRFNLGKGIELPSEDKLKMMDAPAFGIRLNEVIMEFFEQPDLKQVAKVLGVPIPEAVVNTVAQGKMSRVKDLVELAEKHDKEGANRTAIENLRDFADRFRNLRPSKIKSPEQWKSFVNRFMTQHDWERRLHFDTLLQNFGFEYEFAKLLSRQTYTWPNGEENLYDQYAFRWISKALSGYGPPGPVTDVVNLCFALANKEYQPDMGEQDIIQTVSGVLNRIKSQNTSDLWIPTHFVMDAEFDDVLCWILLEYLYRRSNSHFQVLMQFPPGPEFTEKIRDLDSHKHIRVIVDPESKNQAAVKLGMGISE